MEPLNGHLLACLDRWVLAFQSGGQDLKLLFSLSYRLILTLQDLSHRGLSDGVNGSLNRLRYMVVTDPSRYVILSSRESTLKVAFRCAMDRCYDTKCDDFTHLGE